MTKKDMRSFLDLKLSNALVRDDASAFSALSDFAFFSDLISAKEMKALYIIWLTIFS